MPYNVADATRDMDDLIVRPAHVFKEKQDIDVKIQHRAEAIDPAGKTVTGRTSAGEPFQLPYDKLLIATGARPVIPDLPGVESPGVMALKNLEDGRKIKTCIRDRNVKKAVILGMGYIAFEMCEAFRARGIDVEMIKPRPVFIPWMNEQLASIVKKELEANQVKVHLG
jgi:NADPH-dependent 2,4-dienoyl-CoA reductase/sulfur reductase-like enzyme